MNNPPEGRENWETYLIWDSEPCSKIDRPSIENAVKARFGAGEYELKQVEGFWELTAPGALTNVRLSGWTGE